MPKEITHWIIARRVAEELPEGALARAVREHPRALLLGSVFHDVAYYGRGEAAHLVDLADRLHGARGEDTHELPRALAPRADPVERPWLAAFLVGLVTHIVADSRLHPLVYYFTGNYYDREPERRDVAAEAHRRLEVVIDLHLAPTLSGQSLRRILDSLEPPVAELLAEVADGLRSEAPDKLATDLQAALDFFARVQAAIRRPIFLRVLEPLLPALPRSVTRDLALAYFPGLSKLTPRLERELRYRNPMTGEERRDRIRDAVDEIVRASVARCRDLPGSVAAPGPSLELGIPATPAVEARFFHPLVLAGDDRAVTALATLGEEETDEAR